MMLKNICPDNECTGCMACVNSCAHSAIIKISDELGFVYPRIHANQCKDCGLCYRVCPQLKLQQVNAPIRCFAFALQNESKILECSSGGLATAVSEFIIERGGIVVGCSGQSITDVHHIMVEHIDDLKFLQGSKYVQSRIPDSLFKDIRKGLNAGKEILFIGTGCQVSGLYNFLMKPYDNLYTIDLVCHGVPSQKMLNDNIGYYEDINIETIKFRHKIPNNLGTHSIRFGWWYKTENINDDSYKCTPWHIDPYLSSFMAGINFRAACYSCNYAQHKRIADITIGDFWGLSFNSQIKNSSGVSCVLVNSQKGVQLLDKVKHIALIEERPIAEAIAGNTQLQHPSKYPRNRDRFKKLYAKYGLKIAASKTILRKMLIKRIITSLKARLHL